MSGNIIYDLIEPALLIEYVRAWDNEVLRNQFALERYLPNREIMDLEYRLRTGTFEDVDVATYRAWDTPPTVGKRQGFGKVQGEILPISRQIPMGEEHMLRLRSLLMEGGEDAGLVSQIYADAERMVRAVQARIEVARGQVLTTGKFTLTNENGLTLEADFGLPAGNIVDASASWATTTTDILGDMLTWQEYMIDTYGIAPAEMLMSTKSFNYFLVNDSFKNMAAFGGTTPTRLTAPVVLEILAGLGLPTPVIYDTKVRIAGTPTRVIPEDLVVFLPPATEMLGQTMYGVTAEALKLASKGYIERSAMPGIVAVVLENDQPVQMTTSAHATAVPVLGNPELLLVADVVP